MNLATIRRSTLLSLALFTLTGCEGAPDRAEPIEPERGAEPVQAATACDQPDPRYDGVYGVTFYVDGQQTAVGAVTVADGRFIGDIVGLNARVKGEGCVVTGGDVVFERVDAAGGVPVTISAQIRDGVVTGKYSVTTPTHMVVGEIAGSLNNRPFDESHTEFDGTYDVIFFLDGEPRSVAAFEVENSGFTGKVPVGDDEYLLMQGYITSDGLAVLTGVDGTLDTTMAEARLDQDAFEGTGVYRWGDMAGKIMAVRRAE
jgi:hypothetical protein